MNISAILVGGILVLSVISGMLGLGVAFAAIPFLGLFMNDLVHQVQPLSLLLNGVTALLATFGFAKSGLVDWKRAVQLAAVTTVFAPVGSYIVQHVEQSYVWLFYLGAVVYLSYRLFIPAKQTDGREHFAALIALAVPISIMSGFLGVGPGFLLMPTLIVAGFEPKRAVAINAFAVTPPSFSALIPHIGTAQWNAELTAVLLAAGAIGSFAGARLTSVYLPAPLLKRLFAIVILIVTAYKTFTLIDIK